MHGLLKTDTKRNICDQYVLIYVFGNLCFFRLLTQMCLITQLFNFLFFTAILCASESHTSRKTNNVTFLFSQTYYINFYSY